MKIATMGVVGLVMMFVTTVSRADIYYRMQVRDLDFTEDQGDLEGALERSVDRGQMGGLRVPAEAYVAGMVAEGGGQQWLWKQGDLTVAFRVEQDEKLAGWVDMLPEEDQKIEGFSFSLNTETARPCSQAEFEQVKNAHYARLRDGRSVGSAWFRHQAGAGAGDDRISRREDGLERTFAVFSGGRAISENLALDRDLILATNDGGKEIPVSEIRGVTVKAIDWKERLPDEAVAVDALSLAIPLDQHAMFCPSLSGMLDLIGLAERDAAPVMQAYSVRNPFRKLATKYRKQMGLDLPDMTARLLPVKSVAVTGGDPFFPLGTDVAVLFETDKPDRLYQMLLGGIQLKAREHGAEAKRESGDGYEYRGFVTRDRRFSSYVLRRGNVVAVSNSLAQLERLLDVGGEVPALGASDEFRFFRHRYPLGADESAFVFLSDAALRRWSGPGIRIGASRRTRALAALSAQASRVISGIPASDEFDALLGKLVVEEDRVTSARYGSTDFLTPISELGITMVSKAESEAYERWRTGYERGWARFFDPIALRMAVSDDAMDFDLTVLPLTVGSDYQEMIGLAGSAKLSAMARTVPADSLMHLAVAVDRKSGKFAEFDRELPGMLPGLKINPLAWVGDSVSIDLEQGFFWKAMASVGMDFDMLMYTPVVLRVESTSRLKLAAFLTGVRAAVETSAPDLLGWDLKKHGDKSYVVMRGKEDDIPETFSICYAALSKALLIALDEDVLKRAMDRESAGPDEAVVPAVEAPQLLLETSPDFIAEYGRLMGDGDVEDRRQQESWRALPVLNEWHRGFPGKDPVAFHRDVYGVDIYCPGGRGYRWNETAWTMESVAYGHPAGPRNESDTIQLIGKFESVRAGIGFEDGGLRARLKLGPKVKPAVAKPGEVTGAVLATASELTPQKSGTVMKYSGDGPDGKESMISRITKVEKDGGAVTIETEVEYKVADETYLTKSTNRLDGGLYLHEGADEESRTTYDTPELELPAELVEGMIEIAPYSGRTVYEDAELGEEKIFGEYQIKVVGLEQVEVPAGKFDQCVRVDGAWKSVSGDYYREERSVSWYAKGVGLVKYEMSVQGQRTVMELVEITR